MGVGYPGGSVVPTSDDLAYKALEDWFDAVTSFMGTEEELYDLLDRFEAWVRIQKKLFRLAAKVLIFCVRKEFEKRKMELEKRKEEWEKRKEEERKEKKHKERGGAEDKKHPKSKGEGSGEDRGTTAPASGATKPREKGPGKIVWTSPAIFPYQTTPSKGFEGKDWVTEKKDRVYGIEEAIAGNIVGGCCEYIGGSDEGWQMHADENLKVGLERFAAALQNIYGYSGKLEYNSCYRPLGTDVPEAGDQQPGDEGGYTDTTDDKGHWKGMAADVRTKPVRGYFNIPDSEAHKINFLDRIGEAVGLYRPFIEPRSKKKKEGMHWRACTPTRETYPKITINGVTYGGQKTNL